MPTYMTAFSNTSESWAKLVNSPEDRRETLRPLIESLGGTLIGYWYAFGDVDGYLIYETPDDVTAASLLVQVAASGAVTASTTKLLTVEEMVDAMGRAGTVRYRPPGG